MAKKLAHISEEHSREQTVYEHLTGTAELAKQFAAAFGAEEDGYLLGLLHDIGKYSDAFQHRLDGGVRVDHSTAGAKEACAHGVGYLALAIAGHHGGIPNFGSRADTKNDATLSGRLKRDLEPYDDWKTEVTLPPVKPFNMREFNTGFRLSFYIRMLFSCLVDADFIDTETFMDGVVAPRGNYDALPALLDRLETYIAPWYPPKTELNRKRCAILDACKASGSTAAPGVYTLTVPTGGGKTTAAMAFALTAAVQNCMSRVIYAAPYTSIIDQNADTFEKIFGTENVIEHHSSAEYLFSESPNPAEYRKMLAAENWDAAGRCNREGKRPLDESLVTVFTVQNTTPPPYMRQPAAAMKNISKRMEDITSLAAIRAYFEFYRDLYGKEDLDREKILIAFENEMLPFASVAEKVRVIESCTTPVYIPIDQGEALVERLYRGERSRTLFRKLGQYSVNVYPQQLAALREAGAVQSIDGGALYILADPRRYDSALGLTLDQTETALFI